MVTFLDLPPEIRNRVYFYTDELFARVVGSYERACWSITNATIFKTYMHDPHRIHSNGCNSHLRNGFDFPPQPAISRTCRKVRAETLAIFYGSNSFTIMDRYNRGLQHTIDVHTPFPKAVFDAFQRLRAYLPLMTDVGILAAPSNSPDEMIAAFLDYGFEFRIDALKVKKFRVCTKREIHNRIWFLTGSLVPSRVLSGT